MKYPNNPDDKTCEIERTTRADPYNRTWRATSRTSPCGALAAGNERGLWMCSRCDIRYGLTIAQSAFTDEELRKRFSTRISFVRHPTRRVVEGKPHFVLYPQRLSDSWRAEAWEQARRS